MITTIRRTYRAVVLVYCAAPSCWALVPQDAAVRAPDGGWRCPACQAREAA